MSDAKKSKDLEYRPISRKYLRYLLEGLNDEDRGSGTFAQLATKLLHRRKCANIVPATEPSSGGDHGQDARTQRVLLDSDGRFRLYASPPETPERWIFAFSVTQEWKPKLMSDAAKIIANGLQPDAIIFVTNQFIHPEHIKIDAETAVFNAHGVKCEILDGQWFLDQLYEDDYPLAVEFLGCEPANDPKLMEMFQRIYGLQEGGLSEDEAIELEHLKARVQYRNRYIDTPEHLVEDLSRIGAILAPYEAYIEEAIAWYQEALPELDHLTRLPVGIELLHNYFKARQKLPGWEEAIFARMAKFIDIIFTCEVRGLYHYVSDWLIYLFPKLGSMEAFSTLYQSTLERFRAIDRTRLGELSLAYLDETMLFLNLIEIYQGVDDASDWLKRVAAFLERIRTVGPFPRRRIANVLGILAPMLTGLPAYEACFDRAMELRGEQEGGFSKAGVLRDRAIAHVQARQLEDAIIMGSRAKRLWFSEASIRGYMLMTYAMAKWYTDLGRLQAAEFELLEAGHLAFWQPAFIEPDLLAGMVMSLASIAFEQGCVLRAYRWMRSYLAICHQYRVEPQQESVDGMLEQNLPLVAMRLYASNRPIHDQLLRLANAIDPNLLLSHKEIILTSDEEFDVWLEDLTPEQQSECRDLRRRVHAGEAGAIENWSLYDELAPEQSLEWRMSVPSLDSLTVRITYQNDPKLAQMAFTLAVILQIWWLFHHRELEQLTFADDEVQITLAWMADMGSEPLTVSIEPSSEVKVSVAFTPDYVQKVAGPTSEGIIDYFLKVISSTLIHITLDDPDEVLALFNAEQHGEGIYRLSLVAHPAYLWTTAFAQLGIGEDDAA